MKEQRRMFDDKKIFSDTYEIIEYIKSGGGGVVYKAYHKRLKKEVILKRIKRKNSNMKINRREVDILKNLHHTYLPQVLDFLNVDGEIYTVMSYIPGKSFKELIDEGYTFTQKQLIRWGMQLSSALHYLHSQDPPIIHSDIKPANIMLTPQGNICLIDFNISFFLDGSTVLGYSEGYTSPEQYIVSNDKTTVSVNSKFSKIDQKSDIYSVGATFYHLITGKKAGIRRTERERQLLKEEVSEAFASVILKAMSTDRKQRYDSAYALYQAFQGIYKKDQRYRKLILHQRITRVVLVAVLAGSIVTLGYGIHTLNLERVNKYNKLVEQQVAYRESGDLDNEQKMYLEATQVLASKMESYYQNACTLYEQEAYQECIDFIDYDIGENEKLTGINERTPDLHYLKAECLLELEQYSEAAQEYEKALSYGTNDCMYYRDYAIALAYNGENEKAYEILQKAIEHNLQEDSVYYTKGEIEKSLSDMEAAIEDFQNCIGRTSDEYLKMRAYIMISKIYEEQKDWTSERAILTEARGTLAEARQMMILERLLQTDITLADLGDNALRDEAIGIAQEIIAQGWDTYTTYNTLAVLNQKQQYLDEAEKTVDQMQELFGDDYNIEKRYAFLEIDRQEAKANNLRDYTRFLKYYEKADSMYQDQQKNNDTDEEMLLLENVYAQLVEGGWLE